MSDDSKTPGNDEENLGFGRGYYVFFGAVAGFFVTAALGMTVIIGYPMFQGESGATPPSPPTDTTVSSDEIETGDPVAGEEIYASSCAGCHGADAEGVPGLGPSFIANEFVAGLDDDQLTAFLEEGRPADHPDNTTGVAMPAKGGNPSLTDDDLRDIIAFIRALG